MRESYKRHPYRVSYKLGLAANGIMKAMKIHIVADGGAYCSVSPWVTWRSTVQCGGPYVIDNVNVQQDGTIYIKTGIHENGQGSESAMILILAGELGIKKEYTIISLQRRIFRMEEQLFLHGVP